MGRVIMNGPPECPEACGWCLFCLMEAKQKQWELNQDRIKTAVCGSAPQLGVVDGLCWGHVAGIQPMHQTSLVDQNGVPAGLIKGRG